MKTLTYALESGSFSSLSAPAARSPIELSACIERTTCTRAGFGHSSDVRLVRPRPINGYKE